ncbi:MAG: hypothetical protein M3R24_26100 [Chloroflexota bacterium]|nr:hypothetical protein [Chloroflexota bacterium]
MNLIQRKFYLPADMYHRLQHLAKLKKQTIAQTLRTVVQQGLELEQQQVRGNADVLINLAGLAQQQGWRSGFSDVSTQHDTYFVEAWEEAEAAKRHTQ